MARISQADEKDNPQLADAYGQIIKTRGRVSNILRSYGHAPEGLKRFAALGEYVRYQSELPGRTRELVILTLARGNQYAWSHHHPHAIKAGATQAEIDALNAGEFANTLSESEVAAMRYAQEFAAGGHVRDATFEALARHYSKRQITDLTLLSSYFVALGSTINAFQIELEPTSKAVMKPIS